MAILDKIYKVEPYISSALGKIKLMISSNSIQMNDGSTVEQKISNINSNIENKMPGVRAFTAGSIIKSIPNNSNSVKIFSNSDINTLLGINDSSYANTSVSFVNGDGNAINLHLDGATYLNDGWYATFNGTISKSTDCRVNYIIMYFGSSTPSSSGDVKAQQKTVYSSISEQTIVPDSGYDYLSKVTIKGIPYTETTDSSGGTIVNIG